MAPLAASTRRARACDSPCVVGALPTAALLLISLLLPATATAQGTWDDPLPEEEATPAATGDATASDIPDVDPQAAGPAAGSAPVRIQFQLYPRRPIDLRLRPNSGFRLPELVPAFSPRPPDYEGIYRQPGPQFAIAASIAFTGVSGARDSAKAQEFRDLDDDVSVGLDLFLRDRRNYLRLTGRHLGLDDQDAKLEWRRPGLLTARASFSQIPHNYAFGATSLYRGVGTGVLTIPDEVQNNLQGSANENDAAIRARQAIEDFGQPVDLRHRRDRTGLEVQLVPTEALMISFKLDDESRVGTRPWSGSFGLRNVVEIPWPVDYDSRDARVGFEYFGETKGFLVRGEYTYQTFDNNISSVLFDNPWRAIDSAVGNALNANFRSGSSTGLIDLYPDNEHEQVTLTGVKRNLPGNTTVMATVSRGSTEQDDELIPFSVNTALIPGAAGNPPFDTSDPANRPATNADAELENRLLHFRVTSKPTKRLDIKFQYRDYELDNNTAQIFIDGFVAEDAQYRDGDTPTALTNLPIAHRDRETDLALGIRLPKRTKLTLGYERRETDRDFREVENAVEDTFKISFDGKPAPWVDLRASFLVSDRTIDEYIFDQFYTIQDIQNIPQLPFLRMFDQAARDRDRLQLLATFFPHESVIISGSVIVGTDSYPDSSFGVLGDDHRLASLDLSWSAGERVAIYASYTHEENDVSLQGREWFRTAPSDPFTNAPGLDDPSNWRAASHDEIDTIGFGLEAHLIPERLRFEVTWTFSETDGRIDYESPVGPNFIDLNDFVPASFEEVDDVRFYSLNPELTYTFGERLSLAFAYLRERYDIDDFNLEGFTLVPTTPDGDFNGAIFMGTQFTDFDIDLWALKLKVRY